MTIPSDDDAKVGPWPLSQGQLNTLDACPRKFQYQYLEQRVLPADPTLQEAADWGQRFHRLMEQYLLGLSIEPWLAGDRGLAQCFQSLQQKFPDLIPPSETQLCEHRRSLQIGPYSLTAIYDLLILGNGDALIIDWKTATKPRDRPTLANNWQTQLYLYLLAETSAFPPDSLAMTYWFVRSTNANKTHSSTIVQFDYTADWHQAISDRLTQTLDRLTHLQQQWRQEKIPFPQVNPDSNLCQYCAFAEQCDRHQEAQQPSSTPVPVTVSPNNNSPLSIPAWDTIPEIKPHPPLNSPLAPLP